MKYIRDNFGIDIEEPDPPWILNKYLNLEDELGEEDGETIPIDEVALDKLLKKNRPRKPGPPKIMPKTRVLKYSKKELQELKGRFMDLNEQYSYLRSSLSPEYRNIFDKFITFSLFIKLEKRYQHEKIFIEHEDCSFSILKNVDKAINAFIPRGVIQGFFTSVMDMKPSKEFILIFILKNFSEFINFACLILKIMNKPSRVANKNHKNG